MDMQMDNYHQHLYVPGQEIEKPKTRWIWMVFLLLLVITIIEVGFAFANDAGAGHKNFLQPTAEKWFFITLTLVKAYGIVFYFMHLGDEKVNFKFTISSTTIFLFYFIALMMYEGYALRDIQLIRPDFFKRTYHEAHHEGGHEAAAGHGSEHGNAHDAPKQEEAHH